LKDANGGIAWNEWELSLRRRERAALERVRQQLREEIEGQSFISSFFPGNGLLSNLTAMKRALS